ncbi:DUF1269 domain-containing protein, partial [Paracoccus sanguinis]|uniref:DUF1269 domain-containing protein n=1 Tax=Paracoccus sanguinis TaxID=1545044 RepID=UPI0039E1EC72
MSQLIVIGFDSEADAFALRDELAKAQKEYLLKLEDAVVVTRPTEGEYQLHQALNLTSAGALGGGLGHLALEERHLGLRGSLAAPTHA